MSSDGNVRALVVRATEAAQARRLRRAANEVRAEAFQIHLRTWRQWRLALTELLEAAMSLTGAAMGNIQIVNHASGTLDIVTQRGFDRPFLDFFRSVHDGDAACGTALKAATRIVVEDVTDTTIVFGTRALEVMLDAGVRAVQSTPLFDDSGHVAGILSTHYRRPRRLDHNELRSLDILVQGAPSLISWRT